VSLKDSVAGEAVGSRISLVLIDNSATSHSEVVARLRDRPEFHVLATCADSREALGVVRDFCPDVVLLDLDGQDTQRLTLAGSLHGEVPSARIIILGLDPQQGDVNSLVRAGVSGFIMPGLPFDGFLRTIQSVAAGNKVLPPELTSPLFGQLSGHAIRSTPKVAPGARPLSAREREVAAMIVKGMSNKEIALQLQIALHTVKNHVHSVLSKLAVNSRLDVSGFSETTDAPPGNAVA
jgi:two-component system nitrate/nitrite response regulator NarL